jgi:menaquinone-dependent protoporphyrinogen oxidase
MDNKILLAYASVHGSTLEIAEQIAATMRDEGLVVDLQEARKVQILTEYQAVVLGAPIYMFHLYKDVLNFISHHKNTLMNGLPIAIFAGGPIEAGKDQWGDISKQLDQELAKFPWLKPIAVEIVGGRFDPMKLHFPYNLIPALKQMPAADLRDWTAIRVWASELVYTFQLVMEQ